jgi:TRAP-type C4-dicarboxylate transport system substrate-binding protein
MISVISWRLAFAASLMNGERIGVTSRKPGAGYRPVGWPEVYLALSQGVVDAIETAPGPSFDAKHYEVAKYLTRTDHLIYFHIWVISEQSWKSWPEVVQKAVLTAAQEAAMYNRELRLEQEKGVYDVFAAKGVTVIVPDRAQFAAKLKDVQAAVANELKPMLARIQAVK